MFTRKNFLLLHLNFTLRGPVWADVLDADGRDCTKLVAKNVFIKQQLKLTSEKNAAVKPIEHECPFKMYSAEQTKIGRYDRWHVVCMLISPRIVIIIISDTKVAKMWNYTIFLV